MIVILRSTALDGKAASRRKSEARSESGEGTSGEGCEEGGELQGDRNRRVGALCTPPVSTTGRNGRALWAFSGQPGADCRRGGDGDYSACCDYGWQRELGVSPIPCGLFLADETKALHFR